MFIDSSAFPMTPMNEMFIDEAAFTELGERLAVASTVLPKELNLNGSPQRDGAQGTRLTPPGGLYCHGPHPDRHVYTGTPPMSVSKRDQLLATAWSETQ